MKAGETAVVVFPGAGAGAGTELKGLGDPVPRGTGTAVELLLDVSILL